MIFDPILDIFRGKAVTIPPMDGALKPNTALDDAPVALEIAAPDNLCSDGARLLFTSGNQLFALAPGGPQEIARFNTAVTALAVSPGGGLAIALDTGLLRLMAPDGALRDLTPPATLGCITALAFDATGALTVAQGSARHAASDWAVDLMEKNAEGSVWRVDPATGTAAMLRDGLAFPNGLLVQTNGSGLVVAESWKHRLIGLASDGSRAPDPILSKLPGYPARLSPAADGGAWLALFAPRNRLIEFTLVEDTYRQDMMRDVPREYWIAPALASGTSFLEPLQCGGVKTMGVHKPWSPSRSYGLVVKLDAALQPVASYHSRANGRRHGVTSVAEHGGKVFAAAKGGNAILEIPVDAPGRDPAAEQRA
jgi:Strictosidine synthase